MFRICGLLQGRLHGPYHNFSDGIGEFEVVCSFARSSHWPESRKNCQKFWKTESRLFGVIWIFSDFQKISALQEFWQESCCILTKSWPIFNPGPDLKMILDSTMRFRTSNRDLRPKSWSIVASKLTESWKFESEIQLIFLTYKLKMHRFAEWLVVA